MDSLTHSDGRSIGLRLVSLVGTITLVLGGCVGSGPMPATSAASPTTTPLQATAPAATVPTLSPAAPSLAAPTGRIFFSAIAPTASRASIYVLNADGSGRTKLTGTLAADEPAPSPDGSLVAFVSDGIWLMRADGSQPRQIRHDPKMVEEWPVWSPDGRQIAYLETPTCSPCGIGITWNLNVMNADGSGLRKVTDASSDSRPAWSPDGQAIVFGGGWVDPPTPLNGLQWIRPDGSGLRQFTSGPDTAPTWSPDGRSFAFLRNTAEAPDGTILFSLFVANGDGTSPRQVHLDFVAEGPIAWSPDGGWIAMAGAKTLPILKAGQWDLWIVRPDGTGARTITATADLGEGSPAWH